MGTLAERLELAMRGPPRVSQAALARACGVKPPSVTDWLSGGTQSLKGKNLLAAAAFLKVRAEWLATGELPMRPIKDANPSGFQVAEASAEYSLPIQISDVRGSCGGGAMDFDQAPRAPLLKEPGWFKRYRIKPKDALAVWADGDSMADFIVDGDIVIFDISKTAPRSGKIFLIEHPDGLRIKRLRRDIDGSWILESNNADKRTFPDERISTEHAGLLVVRGEFVYRQGG